MGQSRHEQPARLASKLKEIRLKLNLTQQQMAECLRQVKPTLQSGHVAEFEIGRRSPSLILLLAYSRTAGVSTDVLIDDHQDMPDRLPKKPRKLS